MQSVLPPGFYQQWRQLVGHEVSIKDLDRMAWIARFVRTLAWLDEILAP